MVRILTGADAGVTSPLIMPTDAELRQLAGIVYAKFPRLDTRTDLTQDAHEVAFRRTFWAVGQFGRLPEPERKNPNHLTVWMGRATDLLRDHRIESEIEGRMFGVACLAHGDIPHTIGARWPFDVVLGLTYPHAGTPARDAWRRVLDTGALRPASPIANPDYEPGRVTHHNLAPDAPVGFIGSTIR